jgi:hypothetical protein
VPFSNGFPRLNDFQRVLYFAVLLSTVVCTALLIAPTANHRLLFRLRDKENLVRVSNRLAVCGLAVLSVSLTGAILLISDIIFKRPLPAIVTVLTGLLFAALWGVIPAARRQRLQEEEEEG